jgi:hypothetical protein
MLASQIGNNLVVGMGLKSKSIMAKRLDDDFDKVCKSTNLSLDECKLIINRLGFVKSTSLVD